MVALLVEISSTRTQTHAHTHTQTHQTLPGNTVGVCSGDTLPPTQLSLNTAMLPTEYPRSKPGGKHKSPVHMQRLFRAHETDQGRYAQITTSRTHIRAHQNRSQQPGYRSRQTAKNEEQIKARRPTRANQRTDQGRS